MKALLSSTLLGPIQWYQKLNRYDEAIIEHHDSFQKQTYRNRCLIATANGVQALTVPTVHSEQFIANSLSAHKNNSSLFTENYSLIRISDHGNWRHQHWQALTSAYGDSPFFQYYEDDLRPFFTEQWEFLYDYNEAIRQKMCQLLDIQPNVSFTTEYFRPITQHPSPIIDLREAINPKHPLPDPTFQPRRYYQVYERKHGFLPNLSILDLLCNMGPESVFFL